MSHRLLLRAFVEEMCAEYLIEYEEYRMRHCFLNKAETPEKVKRIRALEWLAAVPHGEKYMSVSVEDIMILKETLLTKGT